MLHTPRRAGRPSITLRVKAIGGACRLLSKWSIRSGLEHVIDTDEERDELHVEMRPEDGAAGIGPRLPDTSALRPRAFLGSMLSWVSRYRTSARRRKGDDQGRPPLPHHARDESCSAQPDAYDRCCPDSRGLFDSCESPSRDASTLIRALRQAFG